MWHLSHWTTRKVPEPVFTLALSNNQQFCFLNLQYVVWVEVYSLLPLAPPALITKGHEDEAMASRRRSCGTNTGGAPDTGWVKWETRKPVKGSRARSLWTPFAVDVADSCGSLLSGLSTLHVSKLGISNRKVFRSQVGMNPDGCGCKTVKLRQIPSNHLWPLKPVWNLFIYLTCSSS